MPIIHIFCKGDFFPPDELVLLGDEISPSQHFVMEAAKRLPRDIAERGEQLGLDDDTPAEGVTVLLHRLHWHSVNVPDVWFVVQLSEMPPPFLERRESVREELEKLLEGYFELIEPDTKRALDIFWGPSHGYIIGMTTTPIRW